VRWSLFCFGAKLDSMLELSDPMMDPTQKTSGDGGCAMPATRCLSFDSVLSRQTSF
jgi:hypothetical protein